MKRESVKKRIEGELRAFPTDRVLLQFDRVPPTEVFLACKAHKVVMYAGTPIACFKCQKLGHTAASCRNDIACKRCGQSGHLMEKCKNSPRCVNCKGPHISSSSCCPLRAREIEKRKAWMENYLVQLLKADHPEASKISVVDTARASDQPRAPAASNASSDTAKQSYAAAVRSVVIDTAEGQQVKLNLPGTTSLPPAPKKNKLPKKPTGSFRKKKTLKAKRSLPISLKPVFRLLNAMCPRAAKCLRSLTNALGPLMSVLLSMSSGV